MTLSEILCDGQSLYVTYIIENEKVFEYTKYDPNYLENPDLVQLYPNEVYHKVDFTDETLEANGMGLMGKYIDEHTFVGVAKYSFNSLKTEVPDNFTFEVEFDTLQAFSMPKNFIKHGKWGFKVPVTVNKDLKKAINIEDAENDFVKVNTITTTPFEMILDINFNDETWSDSYSFEFYDNNNNIITPDRYGPSEETNLNGTFMFECITEDITSIRIVIDKQTFVETNRVFNEDGSSEADTEITSSETIFDKTIDLK